MSNLAEVSTFGKIQTADGRNPKLLHPYQAEAIHELDELDKAQSFASILVLPTGGGKTMTAVRWLLRAAIDNDKKVLWLAHRNLLLDQAFYTFAANAYSELLPAIADFKYRIISGSHDKAVNIEKTDQLLIAGKDSIIRNLDRLGDWLCGEDEVYFVIDEAHHAAARSYKRIIEYVCDRVERVKLLGLTATPFRTNKGENSVLKGIFYDDIAYKISLTELIKQQYLSKPFTESYSTELEIGTSLGARDLKTIERLDSLPENIMEEIASNAARNRLIVNTYLKNAKRYQKTIVFALNRTHAVALNTLFRSEGIASGIVISGVSTEFTDIDISKEDNERTLKAYKNGELSVLINVNILTEGVDVPETQTVFLTRPTVSTVLMTQMVGRALRGVKAGGTENAYIVSFIDNWDNKIAWVSPESILDDGEPADYKLHDYFRKELRRISIEKLEEFARIADRSVDTKNLERVPFIERIPIGMYCFSYIEGGMERSHRILVYNSTEKQYGDMLSGLPALFKACGIETEDISEDINMLRSMCEESYFYGDMFPVYEPNDVEALLWYYAQKECPPEFIRFDDIDRKRLDISVIAKDMIEKGMGIIEQYKYIDSLWNDKDNMISAFFGKKDFFEDQLNNEIRKLIYGKNKEPEIIHGKRSYERLTMQELRRIDPEYEAQLRRKIYESAMHSPGSYTCCKCGYSSHNKAFFEVDHIIPFSKGGLTREDNLQLLCRRCNRRKSDKLIDLPEERKGVPEKPQKAKRHERPARLMGLAEKNDRKAFEKLRTIAEEYDDIEAMGYCGYCYYKGAGVEPDLEKALEYSKRALTLSGDDEAFSEWILYNIERIRNVMEKN